MTQAERIIEYIDMFGSISRREAFIDLGITELPARICELQKKGYTFTKTQETSKNRFGEPVTYTRYSRGDQ